MLCIISFFTLILLFLRSAFVVGSAVGTWVIIITHLHISTSTSCSSCLQHSGSLILVYSVSSSAVWFIVLVLVDGVLLVGHCSCSCGSVIIPGGLRCQLYWVDSHCIVLQHSASRIELLLVVVLSSRCLLVRLSAVGIVAYGHNLSVSGVLVRSSGLALDLRIHAGYESYGSLSIHIVVGSCGDSFDRLILRCVEISSSSFLCVQITSVTSGSSLAVDSSIDSDTASLSIEGSLGGYKSLVGCSSSVLSSCTTSVATVEVPKGSQTVGLVGSVQSWRTHIRSPDLTHLLLLHSLLLGHSLTDLVAIIGSIDIVFGSVDLVLAA